MKVILMVFALIPFMALAWTLNEGLGYDVHPVSSEGDEAWTVQYSTLFDSCCCTKSGKVIDGQETVMQTSVVGPCILKFSWKVSSESGFDYLSCMVDGKTWDSISGEMDWCEEKISIPNGEHVIAWRYCKDKSGTEGEDCGWVAQLQVNAGADDGYPASSGGFVVDNGVLTGWNGSGEHIVMPNGICEIRSDFMQHNDEMTDLSFPSSLRQIGSGAFFGCHKLTNIRFNEGLEIIGSQSFAACRSLLNLRIPDSVTTIEYATFWGAESLTNATFPASLQTLGWGTFKSDCGSLRTVYFRSDAPELANAGLRQWFTGAPKDMVVYVPTGSIGWFDETDALVKKKWPYEDVDAREIQNYDMDGFTKWKDRVDVVTFDANGGVCEPSMLNVLRQHAVESFPTATRSGYEFVGWFTSPEGGARVLENTVVNGDVTWYAHWSAIRYDIQYFGVRGAVNPNPVNYTIEDTLSFMELDDFESYRFTGWLPSGIEKGSVGNKTVRAQYEHIVEITNTVERIVEVTNIVERVTEVEKVVTVFETNLLDVAVTNYVEMVEPDATVVSDEVADFEPATGFDGSAKRTYNGIAYDGDGKLCGLVQISTAKESKRGVKVSGYVMLSDGKKLTIKSVNGSVADGLLVAETSVGKIGKLALAIGSDGFRGEMDEMTLVTANISEAGVVKGNLTVNYIEEKTNKWKTKTATVNGVAAEGTAAGAIKVKNEKDKSFLSVVE